MPEGGTAEEKRLLAQARLSVKLSCSRHADAGKVLVGLSVRPALPGRLDRVAQLRDVNPQC